MPGLESIRERIGAAARTAFAPWAGRFARWLKPFNAQLRSRYQKLEPRERRLISAALGLLAALFLYNAIYVPFANFRSALRTSIEARRRELGQVRRLTGVYLERKAELRAAEQNTAPGNRDFSLFSVLEITLTQSVGRDRIGSITPGQERKLSGGLTQHTVDLKLENVSLAQVVDALYGVRTLAVPVGVASLRITRRAQAPHSYDVDMTCVALTKSG